MEPIYPDLSSLPATINGQVIRDQLEVTGGHGIGELEQRMGIIFTKVSADHSIAVMPVEGNRQPFQLLHGGAHCVLGEGLGSLSANIHAQSRGPEYYAVGIDINATHTGSPKSAWVTGECRAISLGGSLTVHEIIVTDEEGTRCSTVRITNMIRKKK